MRDPARHTRGSQSHVRPVFLGSLLSVLDATGDLPPAFQELRRRFDQAKSHFDAGDLSAERYAKLLSALRCFDQEGRSWTIGASSGLWYRMMDDVWVQSPPPYQSASAISSAATLYQSSPQPSNTSSQVAEPASEVRDDGADGGAVAGDELLFGLPAQLFAEEAVDQGPVPHGSLPSLEPGFDAQPQPRDSGGGDSDGYGDATPWRQGG